MKKINNKNAFTILEMTIVLTIIGLLAGTILTMASLSSNSKLLSLIKELQNYKSAFENFANIYNDLPGDIDNATTIFGTTDVNGNQVYNGNGDGLIGDGGDAPYIQEVTSAFQELSLAGLIQNHYSGVVVPNNCLTNTPHSIYGAGSIYWVYSQNIWGNYPKFNSLFMGGTSIDCYKSAAIAVLDAYNLDVKIDDGLPLTGMIVGYNPNGSCASDIPSNNPNHRTTSYLPSSNSLCVMHMSLETSEFE